MKNQKIFNVYSSKKTKSFFLFLVFIFIVFLYVLVWMLLGEINLLKLNWLIKPKVIDNKKAIFKLNLSILYFCFSILFFSLILFLVLKFLIKKFNWDLLPFVVMANFLGFSLIFSALIPYNLKSELPIIGLRFVIVIFVSLLSFFISNIFTSNILLNNNDSAYIYEEIKQEYKDLQKIKKENEVFSNREKEKNYVEI